MIVKMNKVSVLCLDADREAALRELRDLGVLHLTHIRPPAGADLDQARDRLNHVRRILDVLPAKSQPAGPPPAAAPGAVLRPAAQVLEEVWGLVKQRKELGDRIEELSHECRRLEPFGVFDPRSIADLTGSGVHVSLYQIGPTQPLPAPADALVRVLHRDKTGVYFAVIARAPVAVAALAVRLPEVSLSELQQRRARAEAELREVEEQITAAAGERPVIAAHAAALEDEVAWLEARAGMGAQGRVLYLSGYAPAEAAGALRAAAQKHGWGMLLAAPGADDAVPTLVRNPRWVKPIQAVFDMIGILPGYQEVDISVSFLLFLSVFFAMLVGDAGYGLLFLGLAWLARRKFPALPAHYLRLLQIMSVCTVAWGVLTGVYFGMQPAALRVLTIPWLAVEANMMLLCFFIGAVHLTVAHVWNVARMWNSPRALAQVGWICTTWTMFFTARTMVLGHPFPPYMFGALALGILLIVLFMTPIKLLKAEWFNHVMLPLNLVSNFVDVVSYLRLFAVGAASLSVASSFNAMAMNLGWPQPLAGLAGALILFLGHLVNIVLAAMGVMVHGVRLNTLEFSSHIGMQWSGSVYRPFARRAAPADAAAPGERGS